MDGTTVVVLVRMVGVGHIFVQNLYSTNVLYPAKGNVN